MSTLQDRGRFGFLSRGVTTAGAFDPLYACIANALVGNPESAACIEFTLRGDCYEVHSDTCRLAAAGHVDLQVDGEKAASWRSHTLKRGQTFRVGSVSKGARGYLAVAGGFELPPILSSLSTHVRTGIGPLGGKAISDGAELPLRYGSAPKRPDLLFDPAELPAPRRCLRVMAGPQEDYFDDEAFEHFIHGAFAITPQADRMGFQLKGPELAYRKDIPLISEGVALGSIQAPGGDLFIVNLVDRQTVGGYPKIATVIGADVREFAQMTPGTEIRFERVEVDAAQVLLRAHHLSMARLWSRLRPAQADALSSEDLLGFNLISGVHFAD